MKPGAVSSDPSQLLPGVAVAIRDLAARRLARAYLALFTLGAVASLEALLQGFSHGVAPTLGALPLTAGVLLLVGHRAVQRGFGREGPRWGALVGFLAWIPLVHGLFVVAVPGLRRLAAEGMAAPVLLWSAAYTVLGLRVLRDALRIGELRRLAETMTVMAPEERDGAS